MIATPSVPRAYPLEVYRLQAALRHRRRSLAASVTADVDGGGKSRIPRSRLPQALREELDAVAAAMFGRNHMPMPDHTEETPMHLQLVAPDPDANTGLDVATLCADTSDDGPTAAAAQPRSRAEWRAMVEARCAERGIKIADALREMGFSGNFFSPSQMNNSIRPRLQRTIQQWLDRDTPDDTPSAVNVPPPDGADEPDPPPTPVTTHMTMHNFELRLDRTFPARPGRRYPAITAEPTSMPIDEFLIWLRQIRDLMPGATVTWHTSLSISQEQSQ